MEECIFVTCYPNTDDKIKILKRCITSLKKSGYPIVMISNMEIPNEITKDVEEFLAGSNEECSYLDFFTPQEIDSARNSSKYLLHFQPPGGEVISYRSFSYGRGSTYHWSALSQHFLLLDYSISKKIKRALVIEGDIVLRGDDFNKISENFLRMKEKNLDFILSLEHNMGHMSGNAWFTTPDFWKKVCLGMSKEDFLKSTFPSFSSERYMISRMKKIGGKGEVLTWNTDSHLDEDFPDEWEVIKKEFPKEKPARAINLFFPETQDTELSSNIDRKDQSPFDPLSYVWMGTGKKNEDPVFFVLNNYNGETVKKVELSINIFNGEDLIFSSECNLSPEGWFWTPVTGLHLDSYCIVDILITDKEDNTFNYKDRFGSIGNL